MHEPENYEAVNICPLMKRECVGSLCAWWLSFAKSCAVTTIAGILADSTICNNVWPGGEKN